ncbi:MAG: flagellar motor stator protein MotA [Alphaproteobacteria bacterium]|nr:flagellar motor stator protein MotA [Alphaproteobacteria bacterium]
MIPIIGLVIVFVMVFGGYLLHGGQMSVILAALPTEMMVIFGGACGALITGNSIEVIKGVGGGLGKVFKGPKWSEQDFKHMLCLLFTITKMIKSKGILVIEAHIEKPEESNIFQKYPKILADHFAIDFICDTLRMLSMNLDDAHQVFDAMEAQLEKHHHEALEPQHALQTMADGLPAIGIVAAVLGVINTMASVTEPPEVLGGMIGSALVGTFLGVFLAYLLVGPFSNRLKQVLNEEHQFYLIIRDILVAHLNGNAPQVSVEIGRGQVPSKVQPSFFELEEALNSAGEGGA